MKEEQTHPGCYVLKEYLVAKLDAFFAGIDPLDENPECLKEKTRALVRSGSKDKLVLEVETYMLAKADKFIDAKYNLAAERGKNHAT